MSDTGSIEKEDAPKISFSSWNIYRLLFEDAGSSNFTAAIIMLSIISAVQFIPFYMSLSQELPYIECSNNFCMSTNQEDLDNKVQTLCRGGTHLMGQTHYYSLIHRIFLGYTAVMTTFFSFIGVYTLIVRWNKLFGDFHFYKLVLYFSIQMILFFLTTIVSKVIDWDNMSPEAESSILPVDSHGCINLSVIYSYYRPDDLHNQFWILAAIYFPLLLIGIFHFLWHAIKISNTREWIFCLLFTLVCASMCSGWIFSLIINYAAGIQFSSLNISTNLFRIQQIITFSMYSVVFSISLGVFCLRCSKSSS